MINTLKKMANILMFAKIYFTSKEVFAWEKNKKEQCRWSYTIP